jgi:predicted secreted protein
MTRNAAAAAMGRLGASLGLAALMAAPAAAGDRALLDIIGYSPDGLYFAFEEYGVQDGSGFAYSTIYALDLKADKWLYGTPFHVQASDDDPDETLAEVRARAFVEAQDQLKPKGIGELPAEILAMLGDGVPDADGLELTYAIPSWGPPGETEESPYSLALETFEAKAGDPGCADYTPDPVLGYALTLTRGDSDVAIHRDTTVPKSRGCPLAYRLHAVVQAFAMGMADSVPVAIISMYPFGFEGPDRRFLAVPLRW